MAAKVLAIPVALFLAAGVVCLVIGRSSGPQPWIPIAIVLLCLGGVGAVAIGVVVAKRTDDASVGSRNDEPVG
jgi:drug/metabolite transporter (DMT)-like permease